jgi:hypothetical protein
MHTALGLDFLKPRTRPHDERADCQRQQRENKRAPRIIAHIGPDDPTVPCRPHAVSRQKPHLGMWRSTILCRQSDLPSRLVFSFNCLTKGARVSRILVYSELGLDRSWFSGVSHSVHRRLWDTRTHTHSSFDLRKFVVGGKLLQKELLQRLSQSRRLFQS